MKWHISIILQICINEFSDNAYVINYNERNLAAIEGNNVLEEEHVVQSKLGELWEPLKDDSKSQTKNSSVPLVSYEEIVTSLTFKCIKSFALHFMSIMSSLHGRLNIAEI